MGECQVGREVHWRRRHHGVVAAGDHVGRRPCPLQRVIDITEQCRRIDLEHLLLVDPVNLRLRRLLEVPELLMAAAIRILAAIPRPHRRFAVMLV